MITPSLPQDRAALIDKDFRVTLPYRRWMNDLTRLALELQAAGTGTTTPTDPLALTFTGTGWIKVTGSVASGNITIRQRDGLTTDDLAEGSTNLYFPEAPEDGTTYGRKDGAWEAIAPGGVADGDKGDITVTTSGLTWTIDAGTVTYAKLQDVSATQRALGRNTAGAGDAEEVTLSQLLDWVGSAANGDVLYRTGGAWSRLGIGSTGNVLTVAAGLPAWAAPATLTHFTEGVNTASPNATIPVVYWQATNAATNVDFGIIAKGTGAIVAQIPDGTAAGGNKRGSRSLDAQRTRGNAAQVASGADAVLVGTVGSTASGAGSGCIATQSSTASGANSLALGGQANIASGINSIASGSNANTRGIENSYAHGASPAGSPQTLGVQLGGLSTNATPIVLTSNGSATPAPANQLVVPSGAHFVRVMVTAHRASNSDAACWEGSALIKNISGTTSIVGTPTFAQIYADAGAATWACALSADNTNDCLRITATGVAATNIYWSARVVGPWAA